MTPGPIRPGLASMKRTETHTIQGWGRWWKTQADLDAYKERQALLRRAKYAGYTLDQFEEFVKVHKQASQGLDSLKRREKWIKHEMTRIRKKYDLPSRANRSHLKSVYERTQDPDIFYLLNFMGTSTLNDTERLNAIRRLFIEGKPPGEILFQTAVLLGIDLRKKQ